MTKIWKINEFISSLIQPPEITLFIICFIFNWSFLHVELAQHLGGWEGGMGGGEEREKQSWERSSPSSDSFSPWSLVGFGERAFRELLVGREEPGLKAREGQACGHQGPAGWCGRKGSRGAWRHGAGRTRLLRRTRRGVPPGSWLPL